MKLMSKMHGGPKQPSSDATDCPKFPNRGDKSLTSSHGGETGVIRSGVAPTPKTLGGRNA